MRLMRFVVPGLCLAIGVGAGSIAERPWRDLRPGPFTEASLERLTMKTLPEAEDVDCTQDHGPFYTCRVYTAANRGADYSVRISTNGRCATATVVPRSDTEAMEEGWAAIDGSDVFQHASSPRNGYDVYVSGPSDC